MSWKGITHMLGGVVALLILAGLPADRVQAASETSQVDARVVMAISIANLTGLSFGEVTSSPLPGSVTVLPDSSVIRRGGVALGRTAGSGPATFQLIGQSNMAFSIRLPSAVPLASASGEKLLVSNIQSFPRVSGSLDSSGALVLHVGGVLEVSGKQSPGTYTGMMSVSIDYN